MSPIQRIIKHLITTIRYSICGRKRAEQQSDICGIIFLEKCADIFPFPIYLPHSPIMRDNTLPRIMAVIVRITEVYLL